eukprot:4010842-Pyramimonas_sp.AAC.1
MRCAKHARRRKPRPPIATGLKRPPSVMNDPSTPVAAAQERRIGAEWMASPARTDVALAFRRVVSTFQSP